MIIFIDDDRIYIPDYIDELNFRGYSVCQFHKMESTLLDKIVDIYEQGKIDLLVLDMMMPPDNLFKDRDKDDGKRTGIMFVEELEARMERKVDFPLMFFTHVNINNLDARYHRLQKEDYTPHELANEIEHILSKQ
jgi:CheY-like chemotaxis protein